MDELPGGLWDRFELWRDVRQGEAGLSTRAALSLTAALILLAGALLVLGVMEQASYVRDEHVAIALGLASVLWFVALIKIWATYARFRNVLKTIFGILAIWAVAIPLSILADAFMRGGEEFVIAACILTAIGGSILLITSTAHRVRRGKPMFTPEGLPNINCPSCDYSMVGLHESRCPECGTRYTLDELLMKQDFRNPGRPGSELHQQVPPPLSPQASHSRDPLLLPECSQ